MKTVTFLEALPEMTKIRTYNQIQSYTKANNNCAPILNISSTEIDNIIPKTSFGFIADINIKIYKNAKSILLDMTKNKYEQRIVSSMYHSLRHHHLQFNSLSSPITIPSELGSPFGLGLKFCIQLPRLAPSVIKNTMT